MSQNTKEDEALPPGNTLVSRLSGTESAFSDAELAALFVLAKASNSSVKSEVQKSATAAVAALMKKHAKQRDTGGSS